MIGLVVDTDVFSELAERRSRAERFAPLVDDAEAALAFPTIAELHYGAVRAGWGAARMERLEQEIGRYGILWPSGGLLRLWGRLRAEAAKAGHPLGQDDHANDLWIAACAVHYGVPLLTGNARHFEGFPALRLVPGA